MACCEEETDFEALKAKSSCKSVGADQSEVTIFPPDGYSASKFKSAVPKRLSGSETTDVSFVEVLADRVIVHLAPAPTVAGSHEVCAWFDATVSVEDEVKCAQAKKACKKIPAGQSQIKLFPPSGYSVTELSSIYPVRISGSEVIKIDSVEVGAESLTVTLDNSPTAGGTYQVCAWFEPTSATTSEDEAEVVEKQSGETLVFGKVNALEDGGIYEAPEHINLRILQILLPPMTATTINGLPVPIHENVTSNWRYLAYVSLDGAWNIIDDAP